MIYCLGKIDVYVPYIKTSTPEDPAMKGGRNPDYKDENHPNGYVGGSVWRTKEDAEKFLVAGYAVFGVKADWEKDTEKSKDGDWHDLLVDSELVLLG